MIFSIQSLYGQKFTKKIIVNEQISFTPPLIENKIVDSVYLTISPIDTRSLNKETYLAAYREGVHQNYTIESYQMQFSDSKDPYAIRVLYTFKQIDELVEKGKIPKLVGESFKNKLISAEINIEYASYDSLSQQKYYPDNFNPYKVENTFLGIAMLQIRNESNNIFNIQSEDIQIISENEQISPLNTAYFETKSGLSSDKIRNIYRYNLPDNLQVTPNQRIIKYISFPPINPTSNNLVFKYIRAEKVYDFNFNMSYEKTRQEYETFEIIPTPSGTGSTYIILDFNGEFVAMNGTFIDIPIHLLNTSCNIYGIIYSKYYIKLSDISNISFSDYPKHKIKLKTIVNW